MSSQSLRLFSVYTSAKDNEDKSVARTSPQLQKTRASDSKTWLLYSNPRRYNTCYTASAPSSFASTIATRTRSSISLRRLAITTYQNNTTTRRDAQIISLILQTASRYSDSDRSASINNHPINTYNLLWPKRRSCTWHGSRHRLRFRSRLPPSPMAYIHMFRHGRHDWRL